MSLFWVLLVPGLAAEKPATLRYLRPEGGRYVLESEVSTTATTEGSTYVSKTVRGKETMTLTVRRGKDGKVLWAEAVQVKDGQRRKATLDLRVEPAQLKRGGVTDLLKVAANPVVTTAPDWSDVFELVRRYDGARGGKQEFAGFWMHPSQPHLTPTFSVEKLGKDTVKVDGKEQQLVRYRVKLRSGAYLVWAREGGPVCKILPGGAKAVPVVLEGYEEATRGLKGP